MLKGFKEFVLRGNIIDLAVAVVIGGAFGKIVTSFVADILMPPIGLLLGGVDFSNLFINLSHTSYTSLADAKKAGAPTLNLGLFINSIIDFIIIAFAVYMTLRFVSRFQKKVAAPVVTRTCPECISAIPVSAKRCAFCTSQVSIA
jgi:large conductance mechanosensitive channel